MNSVINLAVKFSGLGWIWNRLDGCKTYLAAAAGILSGLSGLISEFLKLEQAHNAGAILDMLKSLPNDPSWILLVGGLGALGIGHKLEKQNASPAISVTPLAPPSGPVSHS